MDFFGPLPREWDLPIGVGSQNVIGFRNLEIFVKYLVSGEPNITRMET